MNKPTARHVLICVLVFLVGCEPQSPRDKSTSAGYTSARPSMALIETSETLKSFDDVVFELEFAITEQNYRITGRNTIGKGLRTRGYENFPDVEVIHFCNLEYAREVLAIDPSFVAQMPCRITIHVQDGKTIISLILLPEDHPNQKVNDFSKRMNGILRDIVKFVADPNS